MQPGSQLSFGRTALVRYGKSLRLATGLDSIRSSVMPLNSFNQVAPRKQD